MKNKSQYGKYNEIIYNKENVVDNIGIKRAIYDLICLGNIETVLRWINRIILKKGSTLDDLIKEYLEDHGEKNNIIIAIPGELIITSNITPDSYLEKIKEEETVLTNNGFSKLYLGKNISGNMNAIMIYNNDTAKKLIDSLVEKKIVIANY